MILKEMGYFIENLRKRQENADKFDLQKVFSIVHAVYIYILFYARFLNLRK
jgi:hypothetical protein